MVLVAHDCGYRLSRYTCRATRVAADFLDFIAFCRCSTGVALHPLKILVSHLPPHCAGRCRTGIWVRKGVALHGGVAATVAGVALHCATKAMVMIDYFSGWHRNRKPEPETGTGNRNRWNRFSRNRNRNWNRAPPLNSAETQRKPFSQRNRPNPEARSHSKPSCAGTVAEPNQTGATLIFLHWHRGCVNTATTSI